MLETAVATRARSLTRLNCAEFRDDALVDVGRIDGSTITAASSRSPAFSPAGRGISRVEARPEGMFIRHRQGRRPRVRNGGGDPREIPHSAELRRVSG